MIMNKVILINTKFQGPNLVFTFYFFNPLTAVVKKKQMKGAWTVESANFAENEFRPNSWARILSMKFENREKLLIWGQEFEFAQAL